MSPPETLIAIGLVGASLGALSAWGLWRTTLALPRVRHPGLLRMGSLVICSGLSLAPILALAGWNADRLVVGIASFLMVRLLAVHVRVAAPPPERRKVAQ